MATRLQRIARPLSTSLRIRTPRTTTPRHSSFKTGPAPPRLPAQEQAEFERLQRTANTQEGFNPVSSPDFSEPTSSSASATATASSSATDVAGQRVDIGIVDGQPKPLRKGAPPEFEGEVNPKTGEVGGPKNEPLRWGAGGDYSYNGRVMYHVVATITTLTSSCVSAGR
ncbi:DUF1674-domain-containing protein [Xylariaceae sp. FL1019]|nr:DUF1674-domain-containing protein [Xylariaceae sp. FL1019]